MKVKIHYKTAEEIEIMKQSGAKLREAMKHVMPLIAPGITTARIDEEAERQIKLQGAESSFKRVKDYYWTTCTTVNEQVVHTPPSNRVLKNGDIFTIDVGAYYQGFHSDYSTTMIVGDKREKEVVKFLDVGEQTLYKAIEAAKVGHYLGEISRVIEDQIYGNGYHVMEQLTGHGVGRELHEDPFVPGFLDGPVEKTLKIRPGLVIAIEIIYSMGTEDIAYEKGGNWSIVTADGSLSACFEHTVAITDKNTFILT